VNDNDEVQLMFDACLSNALEKSNSRIERALDKLKKELIDEIAAPTKKKISPDEEQLQDYIRNHLQQIKPSTLQDIVGLIKRDLSNSTS